MNSNIILRTTRGNFPNRIPSYKETTEVLKNGTKRVISEMVGEKSMAVIQRPTADPRKFHLVRCIFKPDGTPFRVADWTGGELLDRVV